MYMHYKFKIPLLLLPFLFLVSCSRNHTTFEMEKSSKNFSQYTIVIDPGHGGKDGGTSSLDKRILEKNLTLSTSLMLQKYLQRKGFNVILTRNKDVYVSLSQRSQFANNRRAHLFVSIHFNAAKNRNAEGIEIFYDGSSTIQSRTKLSKLLAHDVLKNTLQSTRAENRGVKEREFFVIRKTWMPAILVEGGFLTNTNEKNKLIDQRYLRQIALGISRGIEEYYSH